MTSELQLHKRVKPPQELKNKIQFKFGLLSDEFFLFHLKLFGLATKFYIPLKERQSIKK